MRLDLCEMNSTFYKMVNHLEYQIWILFCADHILGHRHVSPKKEKVYQTFTFYDVPKAQVILRLRSGQAPGCTKSFNLKRATPLFYEHRQDLFRDAL